MHNPLHGAFEGIKKHPLIVVLVIGVVLLFVVLFSGGGGGTSAVASGGVDPNAGAEIAAHSASDQANIAASVANNQTAAQLAATQIGANVAMYQTQSQGQVALFNTQAAEDVSLAGLQAQVQIADLSARTTEKQIQASTDQAGIAANTYEYLAHEQADVQKYGYFTQADIANTNAQQNVALSQIASNTAITESNNQAAVAKNQSNNNSNGDIFGAVIGGIFSLF